MHPLCTYPVGEIRMNETHLSPVRRWQLSEQGKQLLLDLTWGQTGRRPGDNGQGEMGQGQPVSGAFMHKKIVA